MGYDREPLYLHPKIYAVLPGIVNAITKKLPTDHTCKMISGHRTPADQFELFKKGRSFQDGVWVITNPSKVVTYKDGYVDLSRHNYLPALSLDIGIFMPDGTYVEVDTLYAKVKYGAQYAGFDWGGDWTDFKDRPHIEIQSSKLFQGSLIKDSAYQWQRYLKKAGKYTGVLDGIFGQKSIEALQAETGSSERSITTWKKLFNSYGALEP